MMERERLLAEGRKQVITYLGKHPGSTFKEIREDNPEILPRHLDEILVKLQTDRIMVARYGGQWGTGGTLYSLRGRA